MKNTVALRQQNFDRKLPLFPSGKVGLLLHLALALVTPFLFFQFAGLPVDLSPGMITKIVMIRIGLMLLETVLLAVPLVLVLKLVFYGSLKGKRLREQYTPAGKVIRIIAIMAVALPIITYLDCLLFLKFLDLPAPGGMAYTSALFFLANVPALFFVVYDLGTKIKMFLQASAAQVAK